jgi:hypothetical protein
MRSRQFWHGCLMQGLIKYAPRLGCPSAQAGEKLDSPSWMGASGTAGKLASGDVGR